MPMQWHKFGHFTGKTFIGDIIVTFRFQGGISTLMKSFWRRHIVLPYLTNLLLQVLKFPQCLRLWEQECVRFRQSLWFCNVTQKIKTIVASVCLLVVWVACSDVRWFVLKTSFTGVFSMHDNCRFGPSVIFCVQTLNLICCMHTSGDNLL